jgi:hypothetical protein
MRNLVFVILVAAMAACASQPHPGVVNVAVVRHEIWDTMQAHHGERTIAAMGKTSYERAVVFTAGKDGARQEETWVKQGGAWQLDHAVAVEKTVPVDAH